MEEKYELEEFDANGSLVDRAIFNDLNHVLGYMKVALATGKNSVKVKLKEVI
jgi:hypothetical protein